MRDLRMRQRRGAGDRRSVTTHATTTSTTTTTGTTTPTTTSTPTHDGAHPHRSSSRSAVLAKNDELAARNRDVARRARASLALNLMSSPGAGKTTLLERTIRDVGSWPCQRDRGRPGDPARRRADPGRRVPGRCRSTPARAATSTPTMVPRALRRAGAARTGSSLFIENVGNLVCPALFDLGEAAQGRGHLGHRGRRQAAEVPAHVRRGGPGRAEQDRPAAVRRLRPRTCSTATPVGCSPDVEVLPVSATTGRGDLDGWFAAWLSVGSARPASRPGHH